ncbi:MAG: hypothetical protein ACRD3S_09590 [Terracidiphilus sp.]
MQDVGGQLSPIRISGQVTVQDDPSAPSRYTYGISDSITNVSGKAIVMTIIHIEIRGEKTPGLDADQPSDDHFFSPKDLQPGEEERVTTRSISYGSPAHYKIRHEWAGGGNSQLVPEDSGSEETPVATAKVAFVQFADGSTWGDVSAGHAVLTGRNGTLNELIKFEYVLDRNGTAAFLSAFANRDTYLYFPLITLLVTQCEHKPDSCLVNGIHTLVRAARQHQEEMKWSRNAPDTERH